MEPADSDQTKLYTDTSDDTVGVGSSLELGNVKQILSVKMEQPGMHYTSIEPLGKGSFGEVHSAMDTLLGREVAIKSLKNQFREEEEVVDRFLKEARGTAQLEHPNIMPVHEMGVMDELGIFFTMKKIEGEDLKAILDRMEAKTSLYLEKYPLNVLLEMLLAVCNGVSFAHNKGVIHRDLKPANIMAGEYGEVLILDWGLVKNLDEKDDARSGVRLRMNELDVGTTTIDGAISGTPNYMSPEQAEGKIDDIGFHSDVYSLGAILYHILTYLPPFEKTQLRKLLENVKQGRFTPPRQRKPELKIPRELDAICMKAMSLLPENRYQTVEDLAEDVRNYIAHREVSAYKAPGYIRFWNTMRRNPIKSSMAAAVLIALGLAFGTQRAMLEGTFRHNIKTAMLLRSQAEDNILLATSTIDELKEICDVIMEKDPSDDEIQLNRKLERLVRTVNGQFNIAHSYLDNIPERFRWRESVSESYLGLFDRRIEFAFYRKDLNSVKELVAEVRKRFDLQNKDIPPDIESILVGIEERAKGIGSLKLRASENVVEVRIVALREINGFISPDENVEIAKQRPPIDIAKIVPGSYMAIVTLSNGLEIESSCPIYIAHGEDEEVLLEFPDVIPKGMAFVPAGTFIYGGDESRFYREKEVELEAYFIKEREVTFSEYLKFWRQLPRGELRQHYCSRVQLNEKERMFHDVWDDEGRMLFPDTLKLEMPVVGITRQAAVAYCQWLSKEEGGVVRLPTAKEWEKAARGVDGRIYVWGNGLDPKRTLTKNNKEGKAMFPLFAPPASFEETDVSPYGVYDMAGNVREMTDTLLPAAKAEFYQLKGGSASTPDNFLPAAYSSDTPVVPSDVGFRYMMEIQK